MKRIVMPDRTADPQILMIDGKAAIGDEIAYHLYKDGFANAVQARDGEQALKLARKRPPDERPETTRDAVLKTLYADPIATPLDDLTLVILRHMKGR
jgi:hypothetical protein